MVGLGVKTVVSVGIAARSSWSPWRRAAAKVSTLLHRRAATTGHGHGTPRGGAEPRAPAVHPQGGAAPSPSLPRPPSGVRVEDTLLLAPAVCQSDSHLRRTGCWSYSFCLSVAMEQDIVGQNMSSSASEASGTHEGEGHTSLTPRRTRSNVWEHFEKELVHVDGEMKAVCKYCHLKLVTKSGTSSLRGHIANACPQIDTATRKTFQASMSKEAVANFVFDAELCREAMVKYIIHAEVPFLQMEDPYLQPWIDLMQPAFKVKHRQTIRNDCFKKFEALKKELHTVLQSLDSRICLTSDIWTASQNLGYMVVTAHSIAADFKIQKKIIWFKVLEYPHSGYAIKEEIVRCLTEWGVRQKLFTLTLDNASNNTSACDELIINHKQELMFEGEHLHVRCSAHILNLLVQDGMEVIHRAVEKIRELLKHIDSSPARLQVFNSLAKGMGLNSKAGIYLDIPTRWNSTFRMLMEALKYKAVINSYAPKYYEDPPDEEEWEKARAVCEFLKAFEELTFAVSAHRKPTAHRFLPLVLCIIHALEDSTWQSTDLLKELAVSMHSKFEKYWSPDDDLHNAGNRKKKKKEIAFSVVLVIATVLDPRRKADYLHFFFERALNDTSKAELYVGYALKWMEKYFTLYQERCARTNKNEQQCARSKTSNVGSPVLGKRKIEVDFTRYASRRRIAQAPKAELDTYFEEPLEPNPDDDDFDVLGWWKGSQRSFRFYQQWFETFWLFLLARFHQSLLLV